MKLRPEDYANTPRDSVRENLLCNNLRILPDEQISEFVIRLLELDPYWGFPIMRRVLHRKKSAEEVFKLGIHLADASSMRFWLEACIPKLGWRKIIGILRGHLNTDDGSAVEYALYWLPRIRKPTTESEVSDLERLEADYLKVEEGSGDDGAKGV
jgi:hypothetical protein